MYWRRPVALLLATATLDGVAATLITVTERISGSACSAVYTSASRSVTVVKSTIIVSPVPWTDQDANSGTAFVLQVEDGSLGTRKKRQATAPVWVMADGNTTEDGSEAAHYMIQDGRLTTTLGGWMSTSENTTIQPFAISNDSQPIQKEFVVADGRLYWNNSVFYEGEALLYDNGGIITAVFATIPIPNWPAVELYARPVSAASRGGSGGGTSSISISTVISMGSMSPSPGSTGGQGGQSSETETMPSSTSPSTSGILSPSGICGPASGLSCAAGKCCSSYGYCGTDATYCGAGCQPDFGICWASSSTSNQGAASTSPNTIMSSSGSQMSMLMSSKLSGSTFMLNPTSSMSTSGKSSASSSGSPVSSLMTSSSISQTPSTTSTFTATGTPIGGNNPGGVLSGSSSTSGMSMSSSLSQMSSMSSMSSSSAMGSSSIMMTSSSMQMGSSTPMTSSLSSNMPSMSMSPTTSSATASNTLPISPSGHCGTQGNGGTPESYTCSGSVFGMCCSNSGFCGNSTDYCVAGCQTGYGSCTPQRGDPITSTGHCGTTAGNQTCTGGIFGPCCSTSGYCGATDEYCAPGSCDPMFGTCNGTSSSTMQMSSTSMSRSMPMSSSTQSSSQTISPSSTVMSSSQEMSSSSSLASSTQGTTSTSSSMMSSSQMTSSSSSHMTSSSHMSSSSSSMMMSSTSSSSSMGMSSSTSMAPTSSATLSSSTMMSSSSSGVSPSSSMVSTSSSSSSSLSRSMSMSMSNSLSSLSSSMMATMSTSGSSMTSSSSTSGSSSATASASNYPPCPVSNGTDFTDTVGNVYVVLCNTDTNPGAYAQTTEPDFASCIDACSGRTDAPCDGVTYSGGNCYFKSMYTGDMASPGVEAAVLSSVLYPPPPPSGTSSSVMSSSTTSSSSLTRSSSSSTITSAPITSSSSSSSTTSSSSTSISPYLILTSPTPCNFGDPPSYNEDDSFCQINLPFSMRIYADTSDQSFASTNGYISIINGSSQYEIQEFPANNIPNNTVAPLFDDLFLYADQDPMQGIFYQFNAANTSVQYEYYLQRANNTGGPPYHFIVAYDSASPGIFNYTYYSVGSSDDEGNYAAVGMQGINTNGVETGFTYSFKAQDILPGLVVQCDTQADTCTTLHAGGT